MVNPDQEIRSIFQAVDSDVDLLFALGRYVVTELDLDRLLERVAELSRYVIDAETVVIPIIDLTEGEYQYQAASGRNAQAILNERLPLSTGMCGWVLRNREPVLFGEGNNMPMGEAVSWEKGLESALLVPLLSRGEILGGISGMGKSGGGSFDHKDLRLLTIIANQVSIAIENARMVSELRDLATYDQLTKLVNRRELEKRIANAMTAASESGASNVLCFLDLDQFKIVNDTCGHAAGDELLRQVGALLVAHVRDRDTVARLGGDEFGLLIEHCPIDKAIQIAETIRRAIEDYRFGWEGRLFKMGISIGLVPMVPGVDRGDEYMIAADQACLSAKREGRNRVKMFSIGDQSLVRRKTEVRWVSRIHDALDRDGFELHCQPIESLVKGTNPGIHYEILLRMRGEDGALIPPGGFISPAERFGLMPSVDRWVVRRYCEWLASHVEHLERLHLCAINLSGQSLGDGTIQDFISERIEENGLPGEKFCFEITETSAISNMANARALIQSLGSKGIKFSLDDFGTGMSSFNYLDSLPAEFIKIDGSFILGVEEDRVTEGLVRAITDIGHLMGKKVIAEFVESEGIREAVRGIGIDFVQGFGVGRPKPLADLLWTS
ncbi:MAG: EAL domain-containing protein, partial [Pseudomonadota bacterium]|nr:EAL domain-containing protein [Pseudomonadota bacterium]